MQQAHEDLGAAQEEVNRLAAAAQDWELVHTTTCTEPEQRLPDGSAEVAGDLPQMPKPEVAKPVGGHSSLGASHACKIKEADKAQVPDFPNLVSLPQWRAQLLNNLAQASGRLDDQVVMKWAQEALDDSKSFDDLGEVKLGLAMDAMLTRAGDKARDIRDKLNRHMLENARKGRVLRGRQLVQLMLECLKTVDQSEAAHCLTHLAEVAIVNDDLQGFLTKWNLVLDGLSGGRPNEVLLRDTFYNKIKDSPSMTDDTRYYDRLPKNHADRTYDKLVEFVEAVITTKRQRYTILERDALMSGKLKTKAAAIPAAPAKAILAPKGAGKGGSGGVSPPGTTNTTMCRVHFTIGQCKRGRGANLRT